uniref:Uncharacterized protein n=1 Tax=Setaria digitata TaxID=48799 RepID=A0A915PHX2_9BILA
MNPRRQFVLGETAVCMCNFPHNSYIPNPVERDHGPVHTIHCVLIRMTNTAILNRVDSYECTTEPRITLTPGMNIDKLRNGKMGGKVKHALKG